MIKVNYTEFNFDHSNLHNSSP